MTSLAAALAPRASAPARPQRADDDKMTRSQLFGLAFGLDLAGWAAVILFFCMI